jgi:hypothetical protein
MNPSIRGPKTGLQPQRPSRLHASTTSLVSPATARPWSPAVRVAPPHPISDVGLIGGGHVPMPGGELRVRHGETLAGGGVEADPADVDHGSRPEGRAAFPIWIPTSGARRSRCGTGRARSASSGCPGNVGRSLCGAGPPGWACGPIRTSCSPLGAHAGGRPRQGGYGHDPPTVAPRQRVPCR